MQFALDENKNRIQPTKEINGYCPCCNECLIAKMGEKNIHHWSHKGDTNCNYKPMTQWHYEWQNKFPEENREIIYIDGITGEKHIADEASMDLYLNFNIHLYPLKSLNQDVNFI
jgi:hypothetical protein